MEDFHDNSSQPSERSTGSCHHHSRREPGLRPCLKYGITIGTEICTIVSQSATSITIIAPSFQTSEELDVTVLNLHNRKFVFEKKFIPILE